PDTHAVLVRAGVIGLSAERWVPAVAFDAAIEDGTNTIFMTFGDDLAVSEKAADSITRALKADSDHNRPTRPRQKVTVVRRPRTLMATKPGWPPVASSKAYLD
ncbi:hypothetical protein PENNAL_c0845G07437, partial [Penicillium nalgiovense]